MNEALYDKAIMRLAADATGTGRLAGATGSATVHNTMCGDRITIDVATADGKVMAVSHEAKACLLCQAAASLICSAATGRDVRHLNSLKDEIEAWLLRGQAMPAGWPGLAAFSPVAKARGRVRCVTLPFEALEKALEPTS